MFLFCKYLCGQSVEGMKVVCHELAQATSDPEGSAMDDIVKDADRLVSCLANKVTDTAHKTNLFTACFMCLYYLLNE